MRLEDTIYYTDVRIIHDIERYLATIEGYWYIYQIEKLCPERQKTWKYVANVKSLDDNSVEKVNTMFLVFLCTGEMIAQVDTLEEGVKIIDNLENEDD